MQTPSPQPPPQTPHRRGTPGARLAALAAALLLLSLLLACSGPDDGADDTPTATGAANASTTTTTTATTADSTETTPGGDTPTDTPDNQQPGETATNDPAATTPTDQPTVVGETPTGPEAATETPALAPTSTTSPPLDVPVDPAQVSISLEQVGSGFSQPTFITEIPDGSGRMVVLEKTGALRLLDGSMFLDLSALVIQVGVYGEDHEQGMLGVAFHPDFASNGNFFVHYNDVNGDHVIARYRVGADGRGDLNSAEVLMAYDQPFYNFQGGQLLFGRDGYLYIGTGTGGEAVELQLQAQDLGNIYGKILRIDVNTTGPNGEPYGIPADNPFVNTAGARAEIWAYGLRNPWRFSFDRATGDLYAGGPGQFTREWINVQPASLPAGQNHGWPIYEGFVCWADWPGECSTDGLLMPVIDFATYEDGNCVIIGGYVARDAAPQSLHGAYVFGDFCSGRIFITDQMADGTWMNRVEVGNVGGVMSSFGEDLAGNLYAIAIESGAIFRLVQN